MLFQNNTVSVEILDFNNHSKRIPFKKEDVFPQAISLYYHSHSFSNKNRLKLKSGEYAVVSSEIIIGFPNIMVRIYVQKIKPAQHE